MLFIEKLTGVQVIVYFKLVPDSYVFCKHCNNFWVEKQAALWREFLSLQNNL